MKIVKANIYYYKALGWLSVTGTIISVATCYWTESLFVDLSFIIWFLLANKLSSKSSAARKWAIGLSVFAVSIVLMVFLEGAFGGNAVAHIGSIEFHPSDASFYFIGVTSGLIFGFPLSLLHPSAKAWFSSRTDSEQVPLPQDQ